MEWDQLVANELSFEKLKRREVAVIGRDATKDTNK